MNDLTFWIAVTTFAVLGVAGAVAHEFGHIAIRHFMGMNPGTVRFACRVSRRTGESIRAWKFPLFWGYEAHLGMALFSGEYEVEDADSAWYYAGGYLGQLALYLIVGVSGSVLYWFNQDWGMGIMLGVLMAMMAGSAYLAFVCNRQNSDIFQMNIRIDGPCEEPRR